MMRVSVIPALIAAGLLSAAAAPQPFHRPLAFEPNQGQAPEQSKWLGQSSDMLAGRQAEVHAERIGK